MAAGLEEKRKELERLGEEKTGDQLLDKKFEDLQSLLAEYGNTAQDNIRFFEQIEKSIDETEGKYGSIMADLKELVSRQAPKEKIEQTIQEAELMAKGQRDQRQGYWGRLQTYISLIYDYIELSAKRNDLLKGSSQPSAKAAIHDAIRSAEYYSPTLTPH